MVSWFNKTGVNFPSICDIKIALPEVDNKYPTKVESFLHYGLPVPNLKFLGGNGLLLSTTIFFLPTKFSNSSSSPTSGISSIDGASGNFSPTCFTQLIMVV